MASESAIKIFTTCPVSAAEEPNASRRLLQHGVAAQALAQPAATAIAWRSEKMSYGALEVESNRLAQLLIDTGCKPGDRVALLMPKRPAAIVGLLGALKAGATYVLLDPADPASRLARVLKAAECRWIFCPVSRGQRLEELSRRNESWSLSCSSLWAGGVA